MRKFKHKPTGLVATENVNHGHYSFSDTVLPLCIVTGSDWEEIKEQIVPPGIVAFEKNNGTTSTIIKNIGNTYDYWVKKHLFYCGDKIKTISQDNVGWSADEMVDCISGPFTIKSFEYHNSGWRAVLKENGYFARVVNLSKIPERKPVVTLQGKDLFNGDSYWFVDKSFNRSHSIIAGGSSEAQYVNDENNKFFSSYELAEQYVEDNKPVYPAGLVEPLVNYLNRMSFISCLGNDTRKVVRELRDKIKNYKK